MSTDTEQQVTPAKAVRMMAEELQSAIERNDSEAVSEWGRLGSIALVLQEVVQQLRRTNVEVAAVRQRARADQIAAEIAAKKPELLPKPDAERLGIRPIEVVNALVARGGQRAAAREAVQEHFGLEPAQSTENDDSQKHATKA